MNYIGTNTQGEELFADAAGSRYVKRNGQVLGEVHSTVGFDPLNPFSENRYKTVLERVECFCKENDADIGGIGAVAAIRAMAKHWDSHLLEGHPLKILATDLADVKTKFDEMLTELGIQPR